MQTDMPSGYPTMDHISRWRSVLDSGTYLLDIRACLSFLNRTIYYAQSSSTAYQKQAVYSKCLEELLVLSVDC